MRILSVVPPIAVLFVVSCGVEEPRDEGPTYHRDVEPIVQRSCLGCHGERGPAPIALDSYEDAARAAGLMAKQTQARTMPPWGALPTDECEPPRPFLGDLHLTGDEIATIAAWSEAGAPKGDPRDAPPAYVAPPAGLPNADLEIRPKKPFDPGEDEAYRCFVLDHAFDADTFVNGYDVVPQNDAIVHHALVYIDKDGASPALADENGSYSCFGGPGVSNTALLGAWAPGTQPFELPEDMGILVPEGSRLVMQVHYHPPRGGSGGDRTKLVLRQSTSRPQRRLENVLLGNFDRPLPGGNGLLPGPNDRDGVEFFIPAGAKGHVERMRYRFEFPIPSIQLLAAGTHQHRVGTDLKIDLLHAAGTASEERVCLLQTPQWDFDWQRIYRYAVADDDYPEILTGDTIELRCTYDNSLENLALRDQLAEERLSSPIDVHLGESTLDEMCIGFISLVYPNL